MKWTGKLKRKRMSEQWESQTFDDGDIVLGLTAYNNC
jgi:hypothetical protein